MVPLFTTPPPADGFASGSVTVTDPTLLAALRSDPGGFYTDLHTTKFPGGAVRAQLHLLNHPVATSGAAALQESVALGSQIGGPPLPWTVTTLGSLGTGGPRW